MVRKTNKRVAENVKGGVGTIEFYDILSADELLGHGTMYAEVHIKPHSTLGFHIHETNTEPYYIIGGKGIFVDNDKSRTEVGPGDCCIIKVGEGHAMENPYDEDLVFMALIYNA